METHSRCHQSILIRRAEKEISYTLSYPLNYTFINPACQALRKDLCAGFVLFIPAARRQALADSGVFCYT